MIGVDKAILLAELTFLAFICTRSVEYLDNNIAIK